jgi:hypothetical protein
MRNVVKWIVGFSFIIAGVLRLAEGSTIGILFIVVGLFVIPPLLTYVETELNFQVPRTLKYTGVVFTLVVIAGTGQKNKTELIPSDDTPIERSIRPTDESIGDVVGYAPSATPEPKEYSIVSDTETFRRRFNASIAKIDDGTIKIKSLSVERGEVNNAFQYMLTDHIAIVGQLNKTDNSIRNIILTLQGDGTMQSGLNIIITITAVIDATNPGLSPEGKGSILRGLGLFEGDVDINTIRSQVTKNGITYRLRGYDMIGLMFTVESDDEKN